MLNAETSSNSASSSCFVGLSRSGEDSGVAVGVEKPRSLAAAFAAAEARRRFRRAPMISAVHMRPRTNTMSPLSPITTSTTIWLMNDALA